MKVVSGHIKSYKKKKSEHQQITNLNLKTYLF